MLARGTLKAGTNLVYLRKDGEKPALVRFVNASGTDATIAVAAGPDGDTPIDSGTLSDGEVGETDLRGMLAVGHSVKVTGTFAPGVTFAVSEVV